MSEAAQRDLPRRSVADLQREADRKRATLRSFVERMHAGRADDLVALESDPAVIRSIKAISGRRVSGVHFKKGVGVDLG